MKAIWQGTVIAESAETVVVEGNHYFPSGTVNRRLLEASETTSVCPWKGTANYYTLNVAGERNLGLADENQRLVNIIQRAIQWVRECP